MFDRGTRAKRQQSTDSETAVTHAPLSCHEIPLPLFLLFFPSSLSSFSPILPGQSLYGGEHVVTTHAIASSHKSKETFLPLMLPIWASQGIKVPQSVDAAFGRARRSPVPKLSGRVRGASEIADRSVVSKRERGRQRGWYMGPCGCSVLVMLSVSLPTLP